MTASSGSANTISPASDVADSLADLVLAIGTSNFPARFLATMRVLAGVDLCSAFRRGPMSGVELLFAAGEPQRTPGFSLAASREYARSYWRCDAQLAPLWRARVRRPLVVRRRASDIADPQYRAACYERAGVIERVSILWPGEPCFLVSGYGTATGASPRPDAAEQLERYAGVLIAALRQHLRAAAAQDHSVDEQGLATQLLALGSGLSAREAEVAAALIMGETQERIARAKQLSPATVVTYRRRAYGKLGVADRRGLLALHRAAIAGT